MTKYSKFPFNRLPLSLPKKISKKRQKMVIQEKHRLFNPSIFNVVKDFDIYLIGTWMNEKYFIDIENIFALVEAGRKYGKYE